MPRELIAQAPRQPALREYEEPPLGPTQVRIRTEFASPKHGTELTLYRAEHVAIGMVYDERWGAMVPRSPEGVQRMFPRPLGNMAVGVVTEVGEQVQRFRPGDRVFGHLPIRETHTVEAQRVFPLPAGLSAEAAVCLDPAVMAYAMRDVGIRLGDRVAVFGLGAIGLMAVQLARLAGAAQVIAVDPIAPRRELAERYGADAAIAPTSASGSGSSSGPTSASGSGSSSGSGGSNGRSGAAGAGVLGEDTGLAIRRLVREHRERLPAPSVPSDAESSPARRIVTGGYTETPTQWTELGVDVAIEATGSTRALHDAIRATRFGGTIGMLSYYAGEAAGLRLGEEFHVNRQTIISCRAETLPMRDAPAWNLERMAQTALDWLATGRLRADGLVSPIVPFAESVEAYCEIDEHPERSIKLGVRF